jgi:UDP-N-acetylmuramoyl-L-alanyl-D-glutamate--2,6-diaminopimelate ligase
MARRLSQIVKQSVADDPMITGVTADSRKVGPGVLFAALPGTKIDGASFIRAAIEAGAAAVLAAPSVQDLSVPLVTSQDVRRSYALAASAFWAEQPAVCVAVTGTNGKTSVATFCRQIFQRLGYRAASMGTLGVTISDPFTGDQQITPPGLTTPDAADVAELMAKVAAMGVTHMALEASSHGIDQRRLDGVQLKAAGFLNLTQDHLDYHGDMASYGRAKMRLFETLLPRGGTAVLNADSDASDLFAAAAVMAGQTVLSVGEQGQGLTLVERALLPNGQRLIIRAGGQDHIVNLPLAGAFQAANALAAAGLCIAAGEDVAATLAALEHLKGAAGRLQLVGSKASGGEVYVDYAHTPDGLQTVLEALRPHTVGRLIVVFGAGGDRDRTKRPLMGEIAARLADVAIVTDDNPRSEEPASIRAAILAAAPGALEVGDRHLAIQQAVGLLGEGDVLVIAGKGHEQGQTIAGVVHPFDDVSEAAAALGLEPVV